MSVYTDSTGLWNYTESGGSATIGTGGGWQEPGNATTLGTSLSGAITIPETVDGYTVTGIDDYAFMRCYELETIDLSGTQVETIGQQAFFQCTSLTSITIPDSVTTIDIFAFHSCSSLETIDLSGTQVTTIDEGVFQNCTSLTSIDLGNSVRTIGHFAFRECSSLASVDLGNSLETIGYAAFYQCTSLTSITIPDSVTTITSDAFSNIAPSSTVTVKDVDPNKTPIQGLEYIGGPGRNHGSDGGLMDGKITGTVTYQPPLTSTPLAPYLFDVSYAYDGTTKYSATIGSMDSEGDNLTFSLSGKDAASFQIDACNNALLESVNPWDLNDPFSYLVTIKATDSTDLSAISLVSIAKIFTGTYLFTNNISGSTLKTLADQSSVSPKDLYDVGYTVDQLVAAGFQYWNYTLDASNNATIGTGGGWQEPGNATTLGTSLSGAITIPSTVDGHTVIGIGSYAFLNCTNLTSIDLSGTIGTNAFRNCTSLTSITVDANNNSFSDINGVLFNKDQSTLIQYPIGKTATSYAIPDSVTTIGEYAFYQCSSLTSIHLPNSLRTIGQRAFRECSSLASVDLGKSLTTIGQYAFYRCSSLTSIDLSGTQVETIGENAFYICTSLETIDLPNSVTSIGSSLFYQCTSLTSITIPDLVETIGSRAFAFCSSLTSIIIPDSVTTIGIYAFDGIGSSPIVYVKDVDPTDAHNMTTLKITISSKISPGEGTVTYTQWNYAPNTPTLSDISCNENTHYTATVSATDNNGDALTFDLSGADYALFTLSETDLSGNAVLSANDVFDFETKETYNITITASDGSLNTSADFTITVNNIVETASELFNANVQGTELKTSADYAGITSQQLRDAGYTFEQLVAADICFVAGTPVNTDQGDVAIDKIDVSKHTIRGKRIVAVTKTVCTEKHLVCIRKDALAKNVPSQDTLTTQNHCFFYNGNMVKAKHLVNKLDNVDLVKYDGCTLYNVLQDKHEKMVVNNLISETLHPEHGIAQIYRYFAENNICHEIQQKVIASLCKDRITKSLTK